MHWIEKHILKALSNKESCRYSELKPEGVEGNLFMYHLKILMKQGYIVSKARKYLLTSDGKSFVAGFSISTGKNVKPPRIFTMIYARNKKGEVLLYKWSKQPYLGHISLPFNRVIYGSPIHQAAEDTLKHKTNLKSGLVYRGVIEVLVSKRNMTSTHYIAHMFQLKSTAGRPSADGLTGQPLWGCPGSFRQSELVNGTLEIIDILETKKSPFFEEIRISK